MIMQNFVALDIETVLSAAALDSSNSEGAATTDSAVTESKTVSARNIMMRRERMGVVGRNEK